MWYWQDPVPSKTYALETRFEPQVARGPNVAKSMINRRYACFAEFGSADIVSRLSDEMLELPLNESDAVEDIAEDYRRGISIVIFPHHFGSRDNIVGTILHHIDHEQDAGPTVSHHRRPEFGLQSISSSAQQWSDANPDVTTDEAHAAPRRRGVRRTCAFHRRPSNRRSNTVRWNRPNRTPPRHISELRASAQTSHRILSEAYRPECARQCSRRGPPFEQLLHDTAKGR
ncbi:hypothetical protein DPSP01_011777 [Paraphaeosphaeria sporulosa]